MPTSTSGKSFVAILSAAALICGQAVAATPGATIASLKGDAMVMAGKAPAAAKAGSALKAGDRIVVRQGEATLRYGDGCAIKLASGSMATVGAKSPCAGGQGVVATQSADVAQWWKPSTPWNASAYLAATGTVLLVGAFAYGLTNPTKCDGITESDGSCTASP